MDTSVGKNILYSSVSNLITPIFTFVFWFITARVSGSETIGLASAVVSLTLVIATIVVLDTRLGMKRYMGIAIAAGDLGKFKEILSSTIVFVSIITIIGAAIIAIPGFRIIEMIGIDPQYTWLIIALIPATAFNSIFSEALIAAHQSKKLVIPLIIGSLARFPLLFIITYLFNATAAGIIFAYSTFLFITTAFYSVYLARMVLHTTARATKDIVSNTKQIVSAGLASWIPHIIGVLGSQLGILSVFSLHGSAETGKFYLAMAIFTFTLFMVNGINRVSHPLIAGMATKEQQASFVSHTVKLAFIFTMPIAACLLFFAGEFLGLIGREYASAHSTLAIFMIGLPLAIINEMVYYFVYGRGDIRTLLYVGFAGNIPRIILYFIIVPMFGLDGAAFSYVVGSVTQLLLSIKIAREHELVLYYRQYIILTAVPVLIGFAASMIHIHFTFSTIIIIFFSILMYIKLGLFTDSELRSILYTGLPNDIAKRIYPTLSRIIQRIS